MLDSPPRRAPAAIFIFITVFIDVLGLGIIIPVAPRLVSQLNGQTEDQNAAVYGILGATYALMQFVFSPVLGSLSDRFGRRPVLLLSLLGTGIDYFAMAFSPTLAFLFVTRAISGISGASIPVANAYIADVTPPEKRAGAYGLMGAAFGIGFVVGPLLGGFLAEHSLSLPLVGTIDGIRIPFLLAGALALANWCYGLFVLPESLPMDRRRAFDWSRANPIGALFAISRYQSVLGLATALFLLQLAMFILHSVWVLSTAHRYGWSPRDVGLSLALVGIGAAVVQGGLARKIIPALGEKRSFLIGVAIAALAYAGYGAATEGWMVYAIVCLASLGGIAAPAGQAILTKSVAATEQGELQGTLTSLQGVAQIFGPILGTQVYAYFISTHAPAHLPGAPFYTSAVLALLGLAASAVALRTHREAVAA
ncbi:MAG TPA: TCR/Tet family MFS transporter [Phycisphaerales bacterium]|nr:TCR/Tet family MFS transporter [Phycisphaerales bacterium]